MDDTALHELVTRAQDGDGDALEGLVRAIQDDVFDLARRMLGDAQDAQDASQEVLVRIVTKLGAFRGSTHGVHNHPVSSRGVQALDALETHSGNH